MTQGWRSTAVNGSPVLVGTTVWALDRAARCTGWTPPPAPRGPRSRSATTSRFATPAVSGTALVVPTLTGVTAVAITR